MVECPRLVSLGYSWGASSFPLLAIAVGTRMTAGTGTWSEFVVLCIAVAITFAVSLIPCAVIVHRYNQRAARPWLAAAAELREQQKLHTDHTDGIHCHCELSSTHGDDAQHEQSQ